MQYLAPAAKETDTAVIGLTPPVPPVTSRFPSKFQCQTPCQPNVRLIADVSRIAGKPEAPSSVELAWARSFSGKALLLSKRADRHDRPVELRASGGSQSCAAISLAHRTSYEIRIASSTRSTTGIGRRLRELRMRRSRSGHSARARRTLLGVNLQLFQMSLIAPPDSRHCFSCRQSSAAGGQDDSVTARRAIASSVLEKWANCEVDHSYPRGKTLESGEAQHIGNNRGLRLAFHGNVDRWAVAQREIHDRFSALPLIDSETIVLGLPPLLRQRFERLRSTVYRLVRDKSQDQLGSDSLILGYQRIVAQLVPATGPGDSRRPMPRTQRIKRTCPHKQCFCLTQ